MAWDADPNTAFGTGYITGTPSSGTLTGCPADVELVCIPLSFFENVSSAEADASTGDTRIIARGFMDGLYAWYNGLATADKPAKATVSRSGLVGTGSTVDRTWTFKATLATTGLEVTSE